MTTPNAGCSHSVYKGLHNIIYVTQWIKTLRISSYKDDGLFLLFEHKITVTILTNVSICHNILLIKKAYT
ncbi:hypothetical protein J28TS4_14620 [Paenibacillus lautus]|nr:hypothetical protein J28TS4_14620 [Paenibacillus lautus]